MDNYFILADQLAQINDNLGRIADCLEKLMEDNND